MEVARVLRRLWVLVVLFSVVAAGAGVGAFLAAPPTQRSTAQVLFVPSVHQPGVTGPTNPFLSLDGSVVVIASLVQISVSDDQTVAVLAGRGRTADYTVEPNLRDNAGPVLIVTAEDHSAAMAQATMRSVIDEIQQSLARLQEQQQVDPQYLVGSVVLTSSIKPEVVRKVQLQVGALALVGTWALLIGGLLLVDRRRRRRRAAGARTAMMATRPDPEDSPARPAPTAMDDWDDLPPDARATEDDDDYSTAARRN